MIQTSILLALHAIVSIQRAYFDEEAHKEAERHNRKEEDENGAKAFHVCKSHCQHIVRFHDL